MSNFFDTFPYLQQMNDQFRQMFGDDFVKNLMNSIQSPHGMGQNGQPSPMANMFQGMNPNAQGPNGSPDNAMGGNREGTAPMWNPFPSTTGGPSVAAYPPTDILESRHELILLIEVPGLEKASDVRLSIFPEQITIRGEIQQINERRSEYTVRTTERRLGLFERTIALPVRVRKQHAKAIYQQGILQIRLLKEGKPYETDGTVIDIDFA